MLTYLNHMSVAAYATVVSFFTCLSTDLKEDERGLSGIVVAVLLILISVLAVVMLWGSLKGWLSDMWGKITGSAGTGGISGTTTIT